MILWCEFLDSSYRGSAINWACFDGLAAGRQEARAEELGGVLLHLNAFSASLKRRIGTSYPFPFSCWYDEYSTACGPETYMLRRSLRWNCSWTHHRSIKTTGFIRSIFLWQSTFEWSSQWHSHCSLKYIFLIIDYLVVNCISIPIL